MKRNQQQRDTRRKVMAIAAGGAALGLGVAATLAAWTDTEWIFGGNGAGGPGIGTSVFEVEQSTVAPFDAASFTDEEENPGGEVVFAPDALDLTPGDVVYAAMALRAAPTSLAGDVTLQPAVAAAGITVNDPDGLLFGALDLRVATDDASFACDAAAFTGAPAVIADGPLASTGGSSSQGLLAEAASTQYYCFELTLPEDFTPAAGFTVDDYMGLSIAPAWEFTAESD